ncbi:DUF6292 family protein [Streptomyces phaeochromogenes]|uniref:DUF6292 family protein n=1 Tax=Streptomyces phaeochromogenes TaxID=1923 RepID=UPI0006E469E5|nr:DUF6292 family protein [Streptomyces phaeochromogenes]
MLLDPPGWPGCAQGLPHWPYLQAVDQALTGRGILPGAVCLDRAGRADGDTMFMDLVWDVSRTAGPGGVRLHWGEDTGWSYTLVRLVRDSALPHRPLAPLHRVFAVPEAVAEMAESLVRSWRTPIGEYGAEWDQAQSGPWRSRG